MKKAQSGKQYLGFDCVGCGEHVLVYEEGAGLSAGFLDTEQLYDCPFCGFTTEIKPCDMLCSGIHSIN